MNSNIILWVAQTRNLWVILTLPSALPPYPIGPQVQVNTTSIISGIHLLRSAFWPLPEFRGSAASASCDAMIFFLPLASQHPGTLPYLVTTLFYVSKAQNSVTSFPFLRLPKSAEHSQTLWHCILALQNGALPTSVSWPWSRSYPLLPAIDAQDPAILFLHWYFCITSFCITHSPGPGAYSLSPTDCCCPSRMHMYFWDVQIQGGKLNLFYFPKII
jgi:hypothetical protein